MRGRLGQKQALKKYYFEVCLTGGDVSADMLLGNVRIWYHWTSHNLSRASARLVLRESWSFLRYIRLIKGTPISRIYLCLITNSILAAASRIIEKVKSSAFRGTQPRTYRIPACVCVGANGPDAYE